MSNPYRAAYALTWQIVRRAADGAETWLPTEYDQRAAAETAAAALNRRNAA